MDDRRVWTVIDAQPITFPVTAELNLGLLVYLVPIELVREALAEVLAMDAFDVVEAAPGTTPVTLTLSDFSRGDWGPSRIAVVAATVRPRSGERRRGGACALAGVVDVKFQDEVLYWALGFGTTVAPLDTAYTDERVTFEVRPPEGGDPLEVTLPRTPVEPSPETTSLDPERRDSITVYSVIQGKPHVVEYHLTPASAHIDPAAVETRLGDDRLSRVLRRLDLPSLPVACRWSERRSLTIDRPTALPD